MSVNVLQCWIVLGVVAVGRAFCNTGADDAVDLTVRAMPPKCTSYYVDCETGDNDNPGNTSEEV